MPVLESIHVSTNLVLFSEYEQHVQQCIPLGLKVTAAFKSATVYCHLLLVFGSKYQLSVYLICNNRYRP